jgi:predicted metal-dependent phosphoesterase TrpH
VDVDDGLLLCELHAHTTWSDGCLTLPDLVDLYGEAGFDVLCVTDHTVPLNDPAPVAVEPWIWPSYLQAIRAEAERAVAEYRMLLIPGLELTENDDDPNRSAHVLALGLERHVSMEDGVIAAAQAAEYQGAALVAAHPYSDIDATPFRATLRIWRELDEFRQLVHRFELFNRFEVFSWVAGERLPVVATGDTHRAEQLSSWKTLVPCRKDEGTVIEYLRSPRRVYLAPFVIPSEIPLPIAA